MNDVESIPSTTQPETMIVDYYMFLLFTVARQSDEALHVDLLAEVDLENAQCRVAVAGDRRHSDDINKQRRQTCDDVYFI